MAAAAVLHGHGPRRPEMVQGHISTIAKDDQSLTLPTLVAPEIAAETIRVLLDEDDITNCEGRSLSE